MIHHKDQMFRYFQERTTAQLRLALAEAKFWKNLLITGKIPPRHVRRNIASVESIINMKRHALGIAEFPS
jgi:hypothetical protein